MCPDVESETATLWADVPGPRWTSNALGFGGGPLVVPRPAGTVRLAFLGGSTSLALEASRDDRTRAERTAALLRARYPAARSSW